MTERYIKSEELLKRALKVIPLGTQTFSKSRTQYPFGVSPYFIKRGKGSRVWDVDGNEYIDFINSLCAVTLGYNDPDVTTAVRAQLDGLAPLIKKHGLEEILSTAGKPCWSFLVFKDAKDYTQWELKTLFLQEIFIRGILTLGTHNMSYAHTDEDVKKLLSAYDEVFGIMREAVAEKTLSKRLRAEPLVPLFRVR